MVGSGRTSVAYTVGYMKAPAGSGKCGVCTGYGKKVHESREGRVIMDSGVLSEWPATRARD